MNPVIWKEQVLLVVGAVPTGIFYGNLDFPDKRHIEFSLSKRNMKERELTNRDKTVIVDRDSLLQADQRHPYLVIYIGL